MSNPKDFGAEWDAKIAAHTAQVNSIKKDVYNALLQEILVCKYTEIYQVEDAINEHLKRIEGVRK